MNVRSAVTYPDTSITQTASSTTLHIAEHGQVRVLTLNRPERRNALDTALTSALAAALKAADSDSTVHAVVLAGNGPAFCAGADLKEFEGELTNPIAQQQRDLAMLELLQLFGDLDVTVIAAITGMAAGLGGAIAVSADLSVMGESAQIGYPEIARGMVPSLVISHLQHRTSRKFAYEMLASGTSCQADQSLARGLVNHVVPDSRVLDTAMGLANQLAAHQRSVLRETKRLFVSVAGLTLDESLRRAYGQSSQRPVAS
ncbi:MAG: enoyl-CoA hydratase/isomerase family protein [Comamonadaceae bacterium]|nr:enoyl-CoA hydratase/isomerase family protein [Comamonadaceae bacterium]